MAPKAVCPCPWLSREFGIKADYDTGELEVCDADKMFISDPTQSHPGLFLRRGTLADLWWWNNKTDDGYKGMERVLEEAGYFDLLDKEVEAYSLYKHGRTLYNRATNIARPKGRKNGSWQISNGTYAAGITQRC